MSQAAIGFRVKSGWAKVTLVAGPPSAPEVVDRRIVQLADFAVPASIQPYHAGLDLPKAEGVQAVARLVKVVERSASRSLAELIEHYQGGSHRLCGAGIVVGSDIDPATIKNEHIRAHAEEGRLFRAVIEAAVGQCGLESWIMVEKELFAKASKSLGISESRLKDEVAVLGRRLGGQWRIEDKTATLAAWMVLTPRANPDCGPLSSVPGA